MLHLGKITVADNGAPVDKFSRASVMSSLSAVVSLSSASLSSGEGASGATGRPRIRAVIGKRHIKGLVTLSCSLRHILNIGAVVSKRSANCAASVSLGHLLHPTTPLFPA